MDILFADDHSLVREGIKPFLMELADDVRIFEGASLDTALSQVEDLAHLDLVILDLHMPGMHGGAGVERVQAAFPKAPIIILSGAEGHDEIMSVIDRGISGFIPKTTSGEALLSAINLVLSGERYIPSQLLTVRKQTPLAGRSSTKKIDILGTLSEREADTLTLLIDGQTNKEIARALTLQEATIKIHVKNIYRKIGAANRAQAVKISLQGGFSLKSPHGA